jgi:hypothetical protein
MLWLMVRLFRIELSRASNDEDVEHFKNCIAHWELRAIESEFPSGEYA